GCTNNFRSLSPLVYKMNGEDLEELSSDTIGCTICKFKRDGILLYSNHDFNSLKSSVWNLSTVDRPSMKGMAKPTKELELESYSTFRIIFVQSSGKNTCLQFISSRYFFISLKRNLPSSMADVIRPFSIVEMDGILPYKFKRMKLYALRPAIAKTARAKRRIHYIHT
ncbi:unnamed protein product, partial [Didymodactylos carnosus]